MNSSTEVDAYIFIKRKLGEKGWDTRNPARHAGGQVYTQNECLSNNDIKTLLDRDRPENIIKISETKLWVIEAKRNHGQLDQAIEEARGYAEKLSNGPKYQVPIISGVAGNDSDGFIVLNQLLVNGVYQNVTINSIEATGLLSPDECHVVIGSESPNIEDPDINERLFVVTAEKINEILHAGSVNPHQRANVVSALLLSMLSSSGPNIEERDTSLLIGDINNRVRSVLRNQGKEGFEEYIKIPLPAATDNHVIFRQALVETLQELRGLNIHSAMRSGADWLGTFYEVFLKYARWAQDLGIVLTPRHITRFAARVMNITSRDIVFDPTCGTGGFLVSVFDEIKQTSDDSQIEKFKRNCVFGLEQDDGIAALAIVNMIFRGDGKNNIEQANCFAKHLMAETNTEGPTALFVSHPSDFPPVTRVLMNPPFAAKQQIKEYKFVDHALKQMETNGLLFSILLYSVMVKPGQYKTWRHNLLREHTLLAVVTFPIDIFYPVSAPPVGVIVKKGVPHQSSQKTLWIRAITDGYLKSKKKRLPNDRTTNLLEDCIPTLRAFLNNPEMPVQSIPEYIVTKEIDLEDEMLELVPEAYLDQTPPSTGEILNGVDDVLKDCAAFLVRSGVSTTHEDYE